MDKVVQLLKDRLAKPSKGPQDDRRYYEEMVPFPWPDDVQVERVGAGGVPAAWISAPGGDNGRVILYLHGGGYVVGSVRTHGVMMAGMARASGARVLGLEYRCGPENPFPAAVEDSVAAYRWLISNGTDPSRVVIAGDSAGGGQTVATCMWLRYLGEPPPAAQVSISGWTDLTQTGESLITNAEVDPSVTKQRLERLTKVYMGDKDPSAPLASPIYGDFAGLPPLLAQVGSIEVLLDDSTRIVDRAKAAGVDATLEVWPDMPHVWHLFAPILKEGRESIESMGKFVRKHTGG
jgi:acetyl esterase/lipase